MGKDYVVEVSIMLNASPSKVWNVLTDPELIKKYLFGTDTVTDWKVGSDIKWMGVWKGKKYEDKGKILKVEHGKLLEYTYWSSMSGLPDTPENYKKVTYRITRGLKATKLTIIQTNNTKEGKAHSEQNWKAVSEGIKKIIEA